MVFDEATCRGVDGTQPLFYAGAAPSWTPSNASVGTCSLPTTRDRPADANTTMHVCFLAVGGGYTRLANSLGVMRNLDALSQQPGSIHFHYLHERPGMHRPQLCADERFAPFRARMWLHSLGKARTAVLRLHKRLGASASGPGRAYLYKNLLHLLLPPWVGRVAFLDHDLFFVRPLSELWAHFGRFGPRQAIGLSLEQNPLYAEVEQRGGLGFNSGVVLFDLDRLRASPLYAALLDEPQAEDGAHRGALAEGSAPWPPTAAAWERGGLTLSRRPLRPAGGVRPAVRGAE